MAKSPAQLVRMFRGQAEQFRSGLALAAQAGDYTHAAFCLDTIREGYLVAGLITWRHQLDNPVPDLKMVSGAVREGIGVLSTLSLGRPTWPDFDAAPGRYVEQLISSSNEPWPVGAFPLAPAGSWDLTTAGDLVQQLDAGILSALESFTPPAWWGSCLASLVDPRFALTRETYGNYMAVIEAAAEADQGRATAAANTAGACFQRRRTDPYYAGGLISDGGGTFNERVVDYRLAGVVRTAFSRRGLSIDGVKPPVRIE